MSLEVVGFEPRSSVTELAAEIKSFIDQCEEDVEVKCLASINNVEMGGGGGGATTFGAIMIYQQ